MIEENEIDMRIEKSFSAGEMVNFQVQYCPKWVGVKFKEACESNNISRKDLMMLIVRNIDEIINTYLGK